MQFPLEGNGALQLNETRRSVATEERAKNRSRRTDSSSDRTEVRISEIVDWGTKVRVIEEVEELGSHLKAASVRVRNRHLETLQDAEVGIRVGRCNNLVTPLLPESCRIDKVARIRDRTRICSYAGCSVEDGTAPAALDAVDLRRQETRETRTAEVGSLQSAVDDRERETGMVEDRTAHLPTFCQQLRPTEVRQHIDVRRGDVLSRIVV